MKLNLESSILVAPRHLPVPCFCPPAPGAPATTPRHPARRSSSRPSTARWRFRSPPPSASSRSTTSPSRPAGLGGHHPPVAVPPKTLLPPNEGFDDWRNDESILDVGTHREPKLELVSEAEPDLIIGGSRFVEFTDDLNDIAPVVDVSAQDDAPPTATSRR